METLREIHDRLRLEGIHTDKGTSHSYVDWYDDALRTYRVFGTKLLEIGVGRGGSLRMWKEYFYDGKVAGIDVNVPKDAWELRALGIMLYQGDATSAEAYESFCVARDNRYNIIIDDGSHDLYDQLKTFSLYSRSLVEGGIYVIEDIQSDENMAVLAAAGFDIVNRRWTGAHDDVLAVTKNPKAIRWQEPLAKLSGVNDLRERIVGGLRGWVNRCSREELEQVDSFLKGLADQAEPPTDGTGFSDRAFLQVNRG